MLGGSVFSPVEMKRSKLPLAMLLAGMHAGFAAPPKDTPEGIDFFEKRIRPVLSESCYGCHSMETKAVMGGLYLDSKAGMRKGGSSGSPAIVPGDPEASLLIKAIRYTDSKLKMPPGKALTLEQVADFEKWVKMGAPDPRAETVAAAPAPAPYDFAKARQWWSLQPVKDPQPPAVRNPVWSGNPVDRFIYAKLQDKKLTPNSPAEKRALIRRATFDLTGLPPAPAEVDAFLKDNSPQAFGRLVDRLLASPHYGERWGRHWLDVVRYADTSGCNSDYPIIPAYRYRNYVIHSFNSDKPYDQFLREQLAGDLLPSKDEEDRREKIVATGYLAIARRFGSSNKEFHLTIEDTIDNLGKGMLGMSIACARCHDHKFDPIPTRDYYALYGIFESTVYAFPGTELYNHTKNFTPLTSDVGQIANLRKWETEVARIDERIEELKRERPGKRTEKEIKDDMLEVRERLRVLESKPPNVPKAYAAFDGTPVNARIQRKGEPKNPGEEVPRGFLEVLGGQRVPPEEKGSGRLELARWVTDANNPLTARVMVNRVWEYHFGKGLVATPNDLGVRGAAPTHPELLDWLAARFIESGWSLKRLHKLIMLTRAYQMASDSNEANLNRDAKNEYLWKFDRRRLDAEEIRDAMLAASGALDASMAESHPFPPETEWRYTQHKPFVANYETNRRSVYLMQQRIRKQPFLELFDGADTNASTAVRPSTTTSLQALYLMNDPFVHDQADRLAVRVGMAYPLEKDRIAYAYQLAYGRPPTPEEIRTGADYLKQARSALRETGVPEDQEARAALASYLRVVLTSDDFLFVD